MSCKLDILGFLKFRAPSPTGMVRILCIFIMYTSKTREHTSAKWYKNRLMLVDNNNYNVYVVISPKVCIILYDIVACQS